MTDFATLVIKADSSQVKTATGDLDKMGKSTGLLTGAMRTLLPALTAVLSVRALGKMADEARKFGEAVGEVSTLLDDLDQMPRIEREAKALAATFGGSPTAQVNAFYQAISAGASNAEEATKILTTANRLAIGGVTDIGTAVDGLTTIVNSFGLEAGQANEVSDAMFVAMRAGKTTIEELSGSVGRAAALASSAGVSYEELLGATAALTAGGIKTSEAVSGLKAALSNVLKPSGDAQKAAEEMGIQFDLAALQSQGLQGFLEGVTDAAGGNQQAMVELFGGVEGLNAVLALTGGSAETFNQIMLDMGDRSGETEKAFDKMTDTMDYKLGVLGGKISATRIEVGQFLNKLAEPIIDDVNANFDAYIGTLERFSAIVGIAASAVGVTLVTELALATGSILTFEAATIAAKVAVSSLAGPAGVGLLVASLGALAIAYSDIKNIQEEAKQGATDWISGDGGLEAINSSISGVTSEIEALKAQIEADNGIWSHFIGSDANDARDRIKELELFLSDLKDEQGRLIGIQEAERKELELQGAAIQAASGSVGVLNSETVGLVKTKTDLIGVNKIQNAGIEATGFRIQGVAWETDRYSNSVSDLIHQMDTEIEGLGRTDRELFILNATRQISEDLTWAEEQGIRAKAAALFDEQQAIRDTAEADRQAKIDAKKALRATERATEEANTAMREQWNDTRNSFADVFVRLVNDGSSAFSSLLDSFKQMVIRMAAQWAASGLMRLFGMGGGGPTSSGGFSLLGGGSGGAGGGGLASQVLTTAASNTATSALPGGGGLGTVSAVASAGSQFIGGLTGTAVGTTASTIAGPPTAATAAGMNVAGTLSTVGSSVMTALQAIPGWGWALGAAALIANALDDSGTMSHNAGMFTTDLGHEGQFDIPAFDSGAQFYGFTRREGQEAAMGHIDSFRQVDSFLTSAYEKITGSKPNLQAPNFIGYDEKGEGTGAFFGSAFEDGGGHGTPIDQQLGKFASRWVQLAGAQGGAGQDDINQIIGSGDVVGVLSRVADLAGIDGSHARGIDRVPYNGYRAELHAGERVQTAQEVLAQGSGTVDNNGMIYQAMLSILTYLIKTFDIVDRWNTNGIPEERTAP